MYMIFLKAHVCHFLMKNYFLLSEDLSLESLMVFQCISYKSRHTWPDARSRYQVLEVFVYCTQMPWMANQLFPRDHHSDCILNNQNTCCLYRLVPVQLNSNEGCPFQTKVLWRHHFENFWNHYQEYFPTRIKIFVYKNVKICHSVLILKSRGRKGSYFFLSSLTI